MALSQIATRGFSTGSNGGTVNLVVVHGYGSGAAPVVATPSTGGGGGRRKWDEVFPRRKRRKPQDSRPLTRAEVADLDALFRERGEPPLSDRPAIVRAEPAVREAARALLLPHGPLPEKPTLELVHGSPLKSEVRDVGPVRTVAQVRAEEAQRVAREQFERDEQERQAQAIEQLLAAIAQAEADAAEQERLRLEAEENEMLDILMMVHEGTI